MTNEVLLAVNDDRMLENLEVLAGDRLVCRHESQDSFLWLREIGNDNEIAMLCK